MLAITGASGFVGRGLTALLDAEGREWRALDRAILADEAACQAALTGCSAVIHLAGLAHRTGPDAPDEAEFYRVNTELPVILAQRAADAGVKRFVFVSTIYVLSTHGIEPLKPSDTPRPVGPYAEAKAEAEAALLANTDIEIVVLRPPLVYGPEAKGNLARLEKLAALPVPLPFGAVRNRRDMIGRTNLAHALAFLADAPDAAGQVLHIGDGTPVSLADLICWMRARKGRSPGLFPVPEGLVRTALRLALGEQRTGQLLDDFRVDDSALRALGWTPPHPAGWDYRPG